MTGRIPAVRFRAHGVDHVVEIPDDVTTVTGLLAPVTTAIYRAALAPPLTRAQRRARNRLTKKRV